MNYTDRQGTDTKAQRNKKKGKKTKQKMGIGTQALQQLEYNFKKSLYKTQNIRNDIKIEL